MSISNIASSALKNAQLGIALTSQNVEGQSAVGYTRRRAELGTEKLLTSGVPNLGTGVSVAGFTRDWSAMLQQQRVNQAGVTAYHGAIVAGLTAVDAEVANPALALDTPANNFFASLATLARNPTDASALIAVKSQGTVLLAAAQHFQGSLALAQSNAKASVADGVAKLNAIGSELAMINKTLATTTSVVGTEPDPSTLDRRDALLMQAGSLVGGDLGVNADGLAYIFVSGQPLVNGVMAGELRATPKDSSPTSPLTLTIRFGTVGQESPPVDVALDANSLQGSIGGQLKLASDPSMVLQPAGVADSRLTAFTDLFAAAAGQSAAGASELTAALAALGGFNAKNTRTADETTELETALNLKLSNLATQTNSTDKTTGGNALQNSLLSAWRAFEGNVGAQVSIHQAAQSASAAVETRLTADFQSQSGVNLDEEAANLMRYQQSYSAASKLLQANNEMFSALIAVVGR